MLEKQPLQQTNPVERLEHPRIQLETLRASLNPEDDIKKIMGAAPEEYRLYRPGFNHYLDQMPKIDPTASDQDLECALTRRVLAEMRTQVLENFDSLDLPQVSDGKFARVILALEEPKSTDAGFVPGTTVVLAIWGKGFASPVHGHAPGLLYEDMIKGAFDVHLFRQVGDPSMRTAVYDGTIEQHSPGIFYTGYAQDNGQQARSAVIHNFVARERTYSMHYLPEQPRNGADNRYVVVNTPESAAPPDRLQTIPFRPGLAISANDCEQIEPQKMASTWKVGDVFLVRSNSVSMLGDHFAVIVSDELVEKPHGLRPRDVSILIPSSEATPIRELPSIEQPLLYRLNETAQQRFYEHYPLAREF